MSHSSEEDTDIRESELEDYGEKFYAEIKIRKLKVKISEGVFQCPFFLGKKKHYYKYKDLLQHASGVGNGSKQKIKCRANHLALAKYLKRDIAPAGVTLQSAASESGSSLRDEGLVYPWMGIVVNLETWCENGKPVGESVSRLRDGFIERGFNPSKVTLVWNYNGFSGKAVVTFRNGLTGFHNAMSFEKAFEVDHHGKSHWRAREPHSSGTYGWVAQDDDYNNIDVVGDYLRTYGDLKTIATIKADEERKTFLLVSDLTSRQEVKKQPLKEIECKLNETILSQRHLMEKEKLHERILQLQKQLAAKQALELEVENLEGKLQELEKNAPVKKQFHELSKTLKEKKKELEGVEDIFEQWETHKRKR